MKLFAVISSILFSSSNAQTTDLPDTTIARSTLGTTIETETVIPGITCFSCHERDMTSCLANGSVVACQLNEETCQLTMRKRLGEVEQVIFIGFIK